MSHFRSVETGVLQSQAPHLWKFISSIPLFEEEMPHFPPQLTDIQHG